MWRYLAGAVGALLLAGGGLVLWQKSGASPPISAEPRAAAGTASAPADNADEVPAATQKTREEKRFARYDKDRDGKVTREEFLATRRKAFAKLDVNSDGKLSFDEWSAKTTDRFAKADGDRNGTLTPVEFATTRIQRKEKPKAPCVPENEG
jgi:hypothetical protein